MAWTPEEDAMLKQFAESGRYVREAIQAITERFGRATTRSAALGRAFRLGIKFKNRQPSPGTGNEKKRTQRLRLKNKFTHMYYEKSALLPPDSKINSEPLRLSFDELPNEVIITRCRYVVNDTIPFEFCGLGTSNGRSYCEDHCRVTYQPSRYRTA